MKKGFVVLILACILIQQVCAQPSNPSMKTAMARSYFPHCAHYEIFMRSFSDANGDGIGDLKGITAKWDYLHLLGVESIWLTPVFPSPSYHKYDVTNYYDIDKDYGTLELFPMFVKDAHKQGFKIIMDLPLNHCSVKHPWFMEAVKNPKSEYRNYFLWTENPPAQDKDHWHLPKDDKGVTVGKEYYYGYFGPEMPDWNYDNPKVVDEAKKIVSFWLKTGNVDGFRMDAAQHIFPEHAKNVAFWKAIRNTCDSINPNTFIVAEVGNTSEVIAPYLTSVNACFDFDLSNEILTLLKNEDASSLNHRVEKIQANYLSQNKKFDDAIFLTNHDQNRLMTELKGNVEKAKLAAAILFTLPGDPFIYYGEEIGMLGQKPDEHIREPMLFSAAASDKMRPKWINATYSTDKTVTPVDAQLLDSKSLLVRYKELLQMRKGVRALMVGNFESSALNSKQLLAYYRIYNNQQCLVLHNVSATKKSITVTDKEKAFSTVVYQTAKEITFEGDKINLPPYSSVILLKPVVTPATK